MDFLLGLLTGVAIGFLWGVWRATQSFIQRIVEQPEEIRELMERVNRTVQEEVKTPRREQEYRTEWHDNVCYLYDNKDNFLAQGNSVTEAMERAEQRFPGLKLNFRVNESKESNQ